MQQRRLTAADTGRRYREQRSVPASFIKIMYGYGAGKQKKSTGYNSDSERTAVCRCTSPFTSTPLPLRPPLLRPRRFIADRVSYSPSHCTHGRRRQPWLFNQFWLPRDLHQNRNSTSKKRNRLFVRNSSGIKNIHHYGARASHAIEDTSRSRNVQPRY